MKINGKKYARDMTKKIPNLVPVFVIPVGFVIPAITPVVSLPTQSWNLLVIPVIPVIPAPHRVLVNFGRNLFVIPAKAGISLSSLSFQPRIKCGVNSGWNPEIVLTGYYSWIPACAGMTRGGTQG